MGTYTENIRLYEPGHRPPRLVAIGGGHGLSAMLRGLKRYTRDITAIVTVADDGGGSGALREDLGMLHPATSGAAFCRWPTRKRRCASC